MGRDPRVDMAFRFVLVICTGLIIGLAVSSAAAQEADAKPPRAPELDTEEMVLLESTEFSMGVPNQEPSAYGDSWFVDQQPETTVRLDRFYVDETEVTAREFALFLTYAGGPHHHHPGQPVDRVASGFRPADGSADEPIRQVTWHAARDYCRWAGKRLPTEAEWEYAASGTDDRTYPWGDDGATCDRAVHFTGRAFCSEGPRPVGSRPDGATPDGILDLGGNVGEWVADWYGPYPETDSVRDNPEGPDSGTYRVVRGGGFLDSGQFLRSTARRAAPPTGHARDVGFRCAISADRVDDVDSSRRGDLPLPPDRQRESVDRFPAPEAPGPEQLATGIGTPGGVAQFGGAVYVVDRDAGALKEIAPEDGSVTDIVSDRPGLTDVAAGDNRLYATDAEGNEVLEIIPGMPAQSISSTSSAPGPIAANGTTIVWGEADRVVAYDASSDSTTELSTDVRNAVAVTLSSSTAFWSEDGDGNYDQAEVSSAPLAGGSETVLFDAGSAEDDVWVPSVAFDSELGNVYFALRRSGFPRQGYLYRLTPSGSSTELTHTPPNPGAITVADGRLYWSSQRSLVSYTPVLDSTFALTARMTRIADLEGDASHIVWADAHTGEVLRIDR